MIHTVHDLVERTRRQHFVDSRHQVDDVHVDQQHDQALIRGHVLDRQAADGFMMALRAQAPDINWRDELTPLIKGPDYSWALCQRAVADVRKEPRNTSERVTQTLFGEPIEVLRYHETWAFVRLSDGYLGWMHVEPLHVCTLEAAQTYQQHATHMVKQPFVPCYAQSSGDPHQQLGLLPFGAQVAVSGQDGALLRMHWPNGTLRWLPAPDVIARRDLAQHSAVGLRTLLPWLHMLIGAPYLWGGKTAFGIDCSGLMQLIFGMIGVPLRRDADQQAQAGEPVAWDQIAFGDLLFFDTTTDHETILIAPPRPVVTHVAMAVSATDFIHASWRGGGVIWGSFDAQSPFYTPTYDRRFLGARRYLAPDA